MQNHEKQLGDLFRAKRKELNLSLKEVENSTSIRSGYIEAIEDGRINQFIANVYATGFIKQYAIFLGLNLEQLMKQHPMIFQPASKPHEFAYGIGTLEVRSGIGQGVKSFSTGVWVAIGSAGLAIAWLALKYLGWI